MSKRAEEITIKAHNAVAGWSINNPQRMAAAIRGYRQGYEQAEKDYIELAQLWVDSGNVNIMSFKQFLKRHETQSNK